MLLYIWQGRLVYLYEEKLSQERGSLSQPSQLLRALTPLPEPTVPPPGGGVLPYICLIGICRLKGYGFCAVLVWNGGVDFACFALNSGMVFDGSAWTCLSFQFQMDKKERVICEFEMDFQKYFCWHSKLSNDDIISAYARSENGSGF